jgi:hypothetical protein
MKLIFNFILTGLLLALPNIGIISARELIIIEHIKNIKDALLAKNILINKFHLPEILIKVNSETQACTKKSDSILQLCILENGEFEIKNINKYVLKSSFNIFFDQKE